VVVAPTNARLLLNSGTAAAPDDIGLSVNTPSAIWLYG
jgi:hypothetical protein